MFNKTFVLVHPSYFERKTDLSDDDIAEILRSEDQNEDRYVQYVFQMKDKSKDLSFYLENKYHLIRTSKELLETLIL